MNGAVILGTPISVDFWQVRRCLNTRLFFLSHMHTDHTVGLTSSWNDKIYCSQQTKILLSAKLKVRSDLIVGLTIGDSVVLDVDECGSQTVAVTLIDAQHCPGSVMFFFEGYFGNILYTGDFRFTESMTQHPSLRGKTVDVLYLDNTYCHPVCEFPSRAEASLEIIEIIRKHPQYRVKIGLRHLGKENLLLKIAIACKCWIGVDPARMKTLKLLEMPDVFTCDVGQTLVQVVTLKSGGEICRRSLETWGAVHPTIGIIPTALFSGCDNPYQHVKDVFVIPYSDHSSYSELMQFVEIIRPRKIIPIVGRPHLKSSMSCFDHLLDTSTAPLPRSIPATVQRFMGLSRKSSKSRIRQNNRPTLKILKGKKPGGVMFDESPKKVESTVREPQKAPAPERTLHSSVICGNLEQLNGILHIQKTLPQDASLSTIVSAGLGDQDLDSSVVKKEQGMGEACAHEPKAENTESRECSSAKKMLYLPEEISAPERSLHSSIICRKQKQLKLTGLLHIQKTDALPRDASVSTGLEDQYLDSSILKKEQGIGEECAHVPKAESTESRECSFAEQMLYLSEQKGSSERCHSVGLIGSKQVSGFGLKLMHAIKRKCSWQTGGALGKQRRNSCEFARKVIESMDD